MVVRIGHAFSIKAKIYGAFSAFTAGLVAANLKRQSYTRSILFLIFRSKFEDLLEFLFKNGNALYFCQRSSHPGV